MTLLDIIDGWENHGEVFLVLNCSYEREILEKHLEFQKEHGDFLVYFGKGQQYLFEEKDGALVYRGRA